MSTLRGCVFLGNFFESFCFYGIKTILFLFLFSKMDYTKDEATFFFHFILILVGFLPLLGIFMIKSLPKKLVIAAGLCFCNAIGCMLLVLGLAQQTPIPDGLPVFIGLTLIAICSGGIRIVLFATGLEQFKLPKHDKKFMGFLKVINYLILAGAALSTAITPVLRDNIHCFDEYGCFASAFALSGIIMILATLMFVAVAVATRNIAKHRHDAGPQQHSNKKIVITLFLLYLHLTLFWALFEQQGSRWTLQATRMDGDLFGYNIKPDQMQLSYYLLKLILVPLIFYVIYPLLYLIRIRAPLLKILLGGLLAAAAFFLAASLEVELEKLDPVLPNSTAAQLRVYNGMHCDYSLSQILHSNSTETVEVEPLGYYEAKDLQKCNVSFRALDNINAKSSEFTCTKDDVVKAIDLGKAKSFFIRQDFIQPYDAHVDKPKLGTPIVRPLINVPQTAGNFTLMDSADRRSSLAPYSTKAIMVTNGEVSLLLNDSILKTFVARSGCVYVLLGYRYKKDLKEYEFRTYNTVEPNTVHMMWQLPQYVCITASEILVTKNAFEFTFSEAPAQMKPVLQSTWSLTMAVGNLFAVIIMNLKFHETQSEEFNLFAYIMLINMLIFTGLAICYKSVKPLNVSEIPHKRKSRSSRSKSRRSRSSSNKLKPSTSISSNAEQIKSSSHSTGKKEKSSHSTSDPDPTRTSIPRSSNPDSTRTSIAESGDTPSSKPSTSHSGRKESSSQIESSEAPNPTTSRRSQSARKKLKRSSSMSSTQEGINQSSSLPISRSENKPHHKRKGEKRSHSISNPRSTRTSIPKSSNASSSKSSSHARSRSQPNESSAPTTQHSPKE